MTNYLGAWRAGCIAPKSDNASGQGCVIGARNTANSVDCAEGDVQRKRIATVTARAALLGLMLRPMADGTWQLLNQVGQPGTVQSLQAAEGLIYGCELVRAEVAELAGRLVRLQGVRK